MINFSAFPDVFFFLILQQSQTFVDWLTLEFTASENLRKIEFSEFGVKWKREFSDRPKNTIPSASRLNSKIDEILRNGALAYRVWNEELPLAVARYVFRMVSAIEIYGTLRIGPHRSAPLYDSHACCCHTVSAYGEHHDAERHRNAETVRWDRA